jgi:hypothetical protein
MLVTYTHTYFAYLVVLLIHRAKQRFIIDSWHSRINFNPKGHGLPNFCLAAASDLKNKPSPSLQHSSPFTILIKPHPHFFQLAVCSTLQHLDPPALISCSEISFLQPWPTSTIRLRALKVSLNTTPSPLLVGTISN